MYSDIQWIILISQEERMEDIDKVIEDTIIVLNTGILRTRTDNAPYRGANHRRSRWL